MKPQAIKTVQTALVEWQGAGALVWLYHASHRQFTLRLHHAGVRGNLHIVLSGCSFFSSPSQWSDAKLTFESVATEQPFPEYTLSDESARFIVRCAHASIERDVEPIY